MTCFIHQSHKYHNTPVPHPTMRHFVTKRSHIYKFILQTGQLWDVCLMHCKNCESGLLYMYKNRKKNIYVYRFTAHAHKKKGGRCITTLSQIIPWFPTFRPQTYGLNNSISNRIGGNSLTIYSSYSVSHSHRHVGLLMLEYRLCHYLLCFIGLLNISHVWPMMMEGIGYMHYKIRFVLCFNGGYFVTRTYGCMV